MSEKTLEQLRDEMYAKQREAEQAAHAYAVACDVGQERTKAFEIYDNIRNATRVFYS